MFDADGTQHVVYRGQDDHIYQLWWSAATGWQLDDLTYATGGSAAAGNPAGYVFDADGTQHVVYRGQDDHIYQLWWSAAHRLGAR